MIFPATAEKLNRSFRLLDILRSAEGDPTAFEALLDAIVGEGRAATFVLQSELAQPGLSMKAWYEDERLQMQLPGNNLLPWLHMARTLSTHREPLGVGHGLEAKVRNPPTLRPGERVGFTPRGEMFYEQFEKDGTLRRTVLTPSDLEVTTYRIISSPPPPEPLFLNNVELSGKSAVSLLAAYLEYLRALLDRAEAEGRRQVLALKFRGSDVSNLGP